VKSKVTLLKLLKTFRLVVLVLNLGLPKKSDIIISSSLFSGASLKGYVVIIAPLNYL